MITFFQLFYLFGLTKGPEWKFLDIAHPSTLNDLKPIGYRAASLDVRDEATPYVGISKGFLFEKSHHQGGVHTTFGLSVI